MQRSKVELVLVTLVVLLASSALCSAQRAAVSGIVRDTTGTAQLGVLVQITSASDSSLIGRAFTDLRGHYVVSNLVPGIYHVQATAALFTPATKPNLQLRAGGRAVVNLTMSTLFDMTSWLPAERRKADEPADDWKWTLRSAANRPILRMVEDGQLVMVSSSASEQHEPTVRGRAAMTNGDGGFGGGGLRSVLTMDKVQDDGSGIILQVDSGAGRTQAGVGPSTAVSAGFERQVGFASTARIVSSFQSHPELMSAGSAAGLQTMDIATAQQMKLGDLVNIEVGTSTYSVHTSGTAFAVQPFIRVMVEPAAGWTFGYRMATSRSLQGFSGLNTVQSELPVAATVDGKLRTERGRHQEISVGRKIGRGQVQLALYRDALAQVALAGTGALTTADLNSPGTSSSGAQVGAISDTMTDSFRLLTSGYEASGINVMMTQPLGQTVWAAVEYSTGTALAGDGSGTATLPLMLSGLQERPGQSAAVALKGSLPGTGTRLRAVYRWQPRDLVTAIDAYREFSDQSYLSFHVRQPVRWGGVLPQGLEASIDVSNLLAQGYQPFLSSDGRTLYLAQTPRTLQAGLSISF
ncbi:carboxypeptidase-like regulatory domain-containing protein [Granulicella arctica]|uniref:carboxypeptidase-like regulatory domain-containing protein n=1 Tax=Granulicella arctica TaxID=940613 RepID=UPI0021DF65BD|nr:carboxypeptidase-like regulatory domain-containing protein [Granulicella arctica]